MPGGTARTVAVIGTGRMGAAMAGTISRAGFDTILWNRDRSKAERCAEALGAPVASSPAEAAAGLDVALSEALVLAERAGVERSVAYDVFASGAAGAPFVQYKRAAFEDPEGTPVAFSLDLMAKDLELITGLAGRVRAPMRQAETTLGIVRSAIADGFGERDLSAIAVFLRGGQG